MGKTSKKVSPKPHLTSTYKTKKVPVRVAYHKYTGKKLPFYCTSYAFIFFLLALTFCSVLISSNIASADQTANGQIFLSGEVRGKPPAEAAQIVTPKNNEKLTQRKVQLTGTCLQDTYVEIYRGSTFLGMTSCDDNGNFVINITLRPGKNVLTAKIRDSLGQYGPNSDPVTLIYERAIVPKAGETEAEKAARLAAEKAGPFIISMEPYQQSIWLGQSIKVTYSVNGDVPPYALSFDWGDGSPSDLIKQDEPGTYTITHKYLKAGKNTLRISGLGSAGGEGLIETVIIVHQIGAAIPGTISCADNPSSAVFASICNPPPQEEVVIARFILPALAISSVMAFSFFIGEKIVFTRMAHAYK